MLCFEEKYPYYFVKHNNLKNEKMSSDIFINVKLRNHVGG